MTPPSYISTTVQKSRSVGRFARLLLPTPSSGIKGLRTRLLVSDTTGTVVGLCVLQSFDNEPYVGYVREDPGFENHFLGQTFEDLAALDQNMPSTEGVSGATMTSQAIAEAIVVAAHSAQENQGTRSLIQPVARRIKSINAPQWGALLVVLAGLFIGFTRMRGQWIGRIAFPLVVFTYLGFGAGALLSQAQLWGWAAHGIPQAAPVLLFLFHRCHPDACHNRTKCLLHPTLCTRRCAATPENLHSTAS